MLKEARVICFLCFYTILNEFAISYFTDYSEFVLILLSAYTIIEYLIFSLVIYWSLKRKSLKRIILIAIPIFLLFSLYQYISGLSDKIDSLSITVENLILICFTLFYFFEQLVEPQDRFVYTSFRFWIILGILIYSTGTFFFFLQSDKLSDDQWKDWSLINYFCTILKIIFFSVAILMKKENSDNISEENPLLDDIFDRTLEFDPTNPEERT
jgi:hypothetical protein